MNLHHILSNIYLIFRTLSEISDISDLDLEGFGKEDEEILENNHDNEKNIKTHDSTKIKLIIGTFDVPKDVDLYSHIFGNLLNKN